LWSYVSFLLEKCIDILLFNEDCVGHLEVFVVRLRLIRVEDFLVVNDEPIPVDEAFAKWCFDKKQAVAFGVGSHVGGDEFCELTTNLRDYVFKMVRNFEFNFYLFKFGSQT